MKIFLFIIDSLRYDQLLTENSDGALTPELHQIANKSLTFSNAFSQSNWTYPSLYSLLTGLYPQRLGLSFFNQKILAQDRILPEILAQYGYHTAVFSSFKTLVSPKTFGSHFHERRLFYLSDNSHGTFNKWLQSIEGKSSLFLFFHLGDFTHVPYCIPRNLTASFEGKKIFQRPVIKALTTATAGEKRIKEQVTSHIPDKGQVTIRYFGLYANAHRGKVRKRE